MTMTETPEEFIAAHEADSEEDAAAALRLRDAEQRKVGALAAIVEMRREQVQTDDSWTTVGLCDVMRRAIESGSWIP
jgi:hypothetical protein